MDIVHELKYYVKYRRIAVLVIQRIADRYFHEGTLCIIYRVRVSKFEVEVEVRVLTQSYCLSKGLSREDRIYPSAS